MLRVRARQVNAFKKVALKNFEDEMVAHSKEFSPRLCEILGDQQLRLAIRQAINRANGYGFSYRGPVRLYIEMMFLCGSAFDSDPQYPAIGEILRASGDQMQRAEQIHEGYLDYLANVSGPGAMNVRKALRDLSIFARQPITFSADDFVPGMLQEMNRVFPQKAIYVGEKALTALIDEGRTEARNYGFPTLRGEVLVVVLMFAFGHGCTNDPLYPWISRTLNDERIINPTARANRLERKAFTWLEHVLAWHDESAQT